MEPKEKPKKTTNTSKGKANAMKTKVKTKTNKTKRETSTKSSTSKGGPATTTKPAACKIKRAPYVPQKTRLVGKLGEVEKTDH